MNQNGLLVVRPSPSNRLAGSSLRNIIGSRFTVFGAVILVVLSIRSVASGGGAFFWAMVFGAVLFLAIGLYYWLYLANTSIYVKDGRLGSTNFLRRRREMPFEDAAALRLCSVTYNNDRNVQPYLIALTKNGRSAFTISSADHFSMTDIGRIASAAGIPVSGSWREQIRLSELDHRFPGALSAVWRFVVGDWRHPKFVSAAITAVLVILIVLVVVFTVLKSQGLL